MLAEVPTTYIIPLYVLLPVIAAAGWSDFARLVIPNRLVMVAGIATMTTMALAGIPFPEIFMRVSVATCAFILCCGMFAAGLLGGGDTKLFPIVMLAIPVAWTGPFLTVFGLSLGVTFLILCAGRLALGSPSSAIVSLRPGPEVPLGVSMALSTFGLAFLATVSL